MAQLITEDIETFKAFEKINSESRQMGANYRDTIAKSCITVISAIIAIMGFLINARQARLLFKPINSEWTLFVIFIGFGLSYSLAVISTKYYANYLSGHSESIRYKHLGNKDESSNQEKIRDKAKSRLKLVARASEILAILGIVGLISFGFIVLNNISGGHHNINTTHRTKK